MPHDTMTLPRVSLPIDPMKSYSGTDVLAALMKWAEQLVSRLHQEANGTPTALLGRLRGNRRDLHFSELVAKLEADHPVTMQSPFEGSDRVSGAVWVAKDILRGSKPAVSIDASLAKLHWAAHANDLPMHVHDFSDRCIIVDKGRGYFHVTNESPDSFTGRKVHTIPARERDVFLFTRGVVHTFSTAEYPMTLLSCQLPYLAFDDPKQYRLPGVRWTAATQADTYSARIGTDAVWQYLASVPSRVPNPIGLQHLVG
jgi:hypothetical protein